MNYFNSLFDLLYEPLFGLLQKTAGCSDNKSGIYHSICQSTEGNTPIRSLKSDDFSLLHFAKSVTAVRFSVLSSLALSLYRQVRHLRFVFVLFFLFALGITASYGQAVGDYQATTSGDWTTLTTWQRYDGTDWVQPTVEEGYPGEKIGTGAVTILAGHNVDVNTLATLAMGTVTLNGTLKINNDSYFKLTTQLLIVTPAAKIDFIDKSSLTLPMGAVLNVSCNNLISTSNEGNQKQSITIGVTTYYQHSADVSNLLFDQLMAMGGNYVVSGKTPLCIGEKAIYTFSGSTPGTWSSSSPTVASVDLTGLVTGVSIVTANINYQIPGCNASSVTIFQTVVVNSNAAPTINTAGAAAAVCQSASAQTTTLVYTEPTNSPTSYSIDWNAAANTAGLADRESTAFTFLSGGGSLNIVITAATLAGSYSGIMTITNGVCENIQPVTVTVNPVNTVTPTSAPATNAQTVCISTAITNITHATTGATGIGTAVSLPAGVTAAWASNIITISGTPTASGIFNYTIPLTGGCGAVNATGTITVTSLPVATISYPGTPFCTSVSPVSVTRTGTAGGIYSVLPAGLAIDTGTGAITPGTSTAGTYMVTYTIAAAGGCGVVTATSPVTIKARPTVTVEYCSAIAPKIRLTATGGGTSYQWLSPLSGNTASIDVDIVGIYSVLVTNGTCSETVFSTVSNEMVVNGNFSAGNTGFTSGYTNDQNSNGLDTPESEYAIYNNAQFTHSNFWGYDHTSGTGNGNANFMIVNGAKTAPQPIVWQQTITVQPSTEYYFSAWAISLNNVASFADLKFAITIGGVTSSIGSTAVLTAGQNNVSNPWLAKDRFYGTWSSTVVTATSAIISILDLNTSANGNDFGLDDISFGTLVPPPATLLSAPGTDAQTRCVNTAITNITYSTGATSGGSVTGLPAGVSGVWAANVFTISGTPTVAGNFPYTVTLTGCGPDIIKNGTITVTPTVTINAFSPATSTRCQGAGVVTTTTTANNSTGITYSLDAASLAGSNTINAGTGAVTYAAGWSGTTTITASAAGCNGPATTTHTTVTDNMPPTFTAPGPFEYCVNGIQNAVYNPNPNLLISPEYDDLTTLRPEYYLLTAVSKLLDLNNYSDNCCALDDLVLHWKIVFAPTPNPASVAHEPVTKPAISDQTGQPSTYGDIQFPGDGVTFGDVIHKITYWLVDCNGVSSAEQTVYITIKPRPKIL